MPIQNGRHFKEDPFKLFVPTISESPFKVPVEKNEAADAVARLHVDEIMRELESQLQLENARREEERRVALVVEAMPVSAYPEAGGAVKKPEPPRVGVPESPRVVVPDIPVESVPAASKVVAPDLPLESAPKASKVVAPDLPPEPAPEPARMVDDTGEEVVSVSDEEDLGSTLKLERIVAAPKIDAAESSAQTQPTTTSDVPSAAKPATVDSGEYLVTAVPKERLEVSTDYVQDLNDIMPSQDLSIERRERKRRFGFFASIGAWVSRLFHLDDE